VALILRYYEDATYEEIADSLDIAASSVGPLLTRARLKIREALT
jgi:DNA-directed RNA polymerase specialized sigma24 family protein